MEYIVKYNFYQDYKDLDINKFLERIEYLKRTYCIKNMSIEDMVKNYFVEIFSWSVIPIEVLNIIGYYLKEEQITKMIDPCCGNAFHSYLFAKMLKLETYTVDIQDEPSSWTDITEKDGIVFMRELGKLEFDNSVLLLSWIDYESLAIELLDLYGGNMVISLGNYEKLSPNYVKLLNEKFKLLFKVVLVMPWGLRENMEIYTRKLVNDD